MVWAPNYGWIATGRLEKYEKQEHRGRGDEEGLG